MKRYRLELASYRRKCHFLEEEKKQLARNKVMLKEEIDELKKELEFKPGSSDGQY